MVGRGEMEDVVECLLVESLPWLGLEITACLVGDIERPCASSKVGSDKNTGLGGVNLHLCLTGSHALQYS